MTAGVKHGTAGATLVAAVLFLDLFDDVSSGFA